MGKFIINFTPTGLIPTKDMVPHVPVSPEEIIKEVLEAREYGVSIVHIHAREKNGEPTWRKEVYKEIIDGIRSSDGCSPKSLAICVSTSGRNWAEIEKRADCLMLDGTSRPDMGSLTLSSLNFPHSASINSPETIQMLANKMKERGIKPELEVFDLGMINYARYLASKHIIEPPFYFNIILGNIASAQAGLMETGLMVNQLPASSYWSAGGIGSEQLRMNVTAMVHGGGIRIGLEDNIWFDREKQKHASNLEMLKRIREFASHLELSPYTPEEVRNLLRLKAIGKQG